MDFTGFTIIDLGGLTDIHAHGDHRALFDDHPFNHFGTGTDEAVILDDGRSGLQWFEYPTDTNAAGEVYVLADLGTGANGGPGIDHGAAVHIGTDVDIGRHQYRTGGDVGTAAGSSWRYNAHTAFTEVARVHIGVLGRYLVIIVGEAALHEFVVIDAEGEQYRLLQPLVDGPLTNGLAFGNTGLAGVQQGNGLIDRFLDVGVHIARGDLRTVFKGLFNHTLQIVHGCSPEIKKLSTQSAQRARRYSCSGRDAC